MYLSNFIRCYQIDFVIISSNLLILPDCWVSTTSHPHWNLILLLLLIFSQSSGYKKGLHYSFFFFFDHVVHSLLAIYVSSSVKFLFISSVYISFELFFLFLIFRSSKYSKYSSFLDWSLIFWKVYSSSLWYFPILCCFWWTESSFNIVMVINALWLWLLL